MLYEIECQCAGTPLNPGQSGCMPMVGRDKYFILFDRVDSTGALNGVTAGTVMNQAWITGKLNDTDQTKRWTIMPEIFAYEAPSPENEVETIDGIDMPTGEEIKQKFTFQHVKEDANPALKASYDSRKCRDLAFLTVTYNGQLAGQNDGDGNLIGIPLQSGSLSAQYSRPTKGAVQKVMVSGNVDELVNDANLDYIPSADIAYPAKRWFALQPIEVVPVLVSQSGQDTLVLNLNQLYGGVGLKKPIEGIVSADWSYNLGVTDATIYNTTTAASVVITSAESGVTPGQYTMTLAAPANPDDILKIDLFLSGYGMRSFYVTVEAS